MFSKPVKTALYILAQALMKLYHLSESWTPEDEDDTHVELTGRQYIDKLDNPEVGADPGEAVFNPAAKLSAAEVFAGGAAPAPVYEMTEKAGTWTREQLLASPGAGWTDELLLSNEMMRVVAPPKLPEAAPTPTAAATPTPGATNAPVLVDTTGLRWDARIHSSTRTTTDKGVWVKRRNVQDAEVARVTAELRQAGGAVGIANFTPLNAAAPAPAAPAPVAAPAAPAAPNPVAAQPAPAPGITNAAQAVAAANSAANAAITNPQTFTEICKWANQNGFTMIDVAKAAAIYGAESAGFLARPEYTPLIPQVAADLLASRAK